MDVNTSVKTAGRTLDVFEVFENVKRPLTLTELARHLGIPMSSCHGLVGTLRRRGYLYSIGGRTFYPSRRLFDLARAIVARDPILERLEPHLRRLCEETGETVLLGKRQDKAVIYLEVVEGPQTIRYTARPGEMKPLHSSAIGKAMLGQCVEAEMERLLQSLPLPSVTPNSITDPGKLIEDIRVSRARGWYLTRGENVSDVMAAAAGVRINDEAYGIAVAGPLGRMEANLNRHVGFLLAAVERIESGDKGP